MIQRTFIILLALFTQCAEIVLGCSDELVWLIHPAHDTPYHRMVRLKSDLECESKSHYHRFLSGKCVKVDRRSLSASEGRYYEVNMNIFDGIDPEKDDFINNEGCRFSDTGCTQKAKVMKVKVAADATPLLFELQTGVIDHQLNGVSWFGKEIINENGTNVTIAGTASFVRSHAGFVSGNVNSILDNMVYSFSTRVKGNSTVSQVELIPQDSFPSHERHLRAPSRSTMQNADERNSIQKKNESKLDDNGRIDHARRTRRLRKRQNGGRKMQNCPENQIDIMIVYTKLAMCADALQDYPCQWDGNFETIHSRIDLAISQANQAYEASGVNTRLRLVGKMMIDYDESEDWTTILGEMYSRQFPEKLYTNRNKFGADVVHMIMKKSDYCGYGYTGVGRNDAYSVSNYKCSTGMYSLVHEIAHNMGCEHNIENASPFPLSTYSFGYQDPKKEFRSIMAYSCENADCKRVQMFSTPEQKYDNRTIGSPTANNALQIQDYTEKMSNFRICREGRIRKNRI